MAEGGKTTAFPGPGWVFEFPICERNKGWGRDEREECGYCSHNRARSLSFVTKQFARKLIRKL